MRRNVEVAVSFAHLRQQGYMISVDGCNDAPGANSKNHVFVASSPQTAVRVGAMATECGQEEIRFVSSKKQL